MNDRAVAQPRPEAATKARSMQALGGLRGFAALAVVAFHIRLVLEPQIPVSSITGVLESGYIWVEMFFILSGYTLTRVYDRRWADTPLDRAGYLGFQWRRIARIYPLHLVLLIAMLLAVLVLQIDLDGKYSLPALASNVLLLHAWGLHDRLTWNIPSWALSALFACYLLFPLLHRLLRRLSDGFRAAIGLACVLILVLLDARMGSLDLTYDWGAVRALVEFTIGALLYHMAVFQRAAELLSGVVAQILITAALLAALHLGHHDVLVALLMAALVLSLSLDRGPLAVPLCSRPMQWLGEQSFAIYLVHYPLGRLFKGRELPVESLLGAHTAAGALSHFVEAMLAFIVAGWLLSRFLEYPMRALMRSRAPAG